MLSLKTVSLFNGSLVNGSSKFTLSWFTLASSDDDIKSINFIYVEFVVLNLLIKGFLIDDDIISINQMFLEFMTEYSLNWVTFVSFSDSLGNRSDLIILLSRTEISKGSLESIPGS